MVCQQPAPARPHRRPSPRCLWREDRLSPEKEATAGADRAAMKLYDPAWSPDGSRIVVTMRQNGTPTFLAWIQVARHRQHAEIFVKNLSDGTTKRITWSSGSTR